MLNSLESLRVSSQDYTRVQPAKSTYLLSRYARPALLWQLLAREDEAASLTHCLTPRPTKIGNNNHILQPRQSFILPMNRTE